MPSSPAVRERTDATSSSHRQTPYAGVASAGNRRLISADKTGVTFKWKDYRIEGACRYKIMTLVTDKFIRRFLIHVLPKASIASGTMVTEPQTLRMHASCLPCPQPNRIRAAQTSDRRTSRAATSKSVLL